MAKTFNFAADDSLQVTDDGGASRWLMNAEQATKHDKDAAWRAAMTAPQRTQVDAIKTRLADEAAAKAAADGAK